MLFVGALHFSAAAAAAAGHRYLASLFRRERERELLCDEKERDRNQPFWVSLLYPPEGFCIIQVLTPASEYSALYPIYKSIVETWKTSRFVSAIFILSNEEAQVLC